MYRNKDMNRTYVICTVSDRRKNVEKKSKKSRKKVYHSQCLQKIKFSYLAENLNYRTNKIYYM